MKQCTGCEQHVRATEAACPFCGTSLKEVSAAAPWIAAAVLGLSAGCGPAVGLPGDGGTATGGTPGTTMGPGSVDPNPVTSASVTGTPGTSTTTDVPTGSDSAESSGTPDTVGFIYGVPDTEGGTPIECDVWQQDCNPGEKCMPWANDGGNAWNATRCSPVALDPAGPGEMCNVEGSGVSGVDSCDAESMCFGVDPKTNEGLCVPFCRGTENNPICDDPSQTCHISHEGALILCLDRCDPVDQDCNEGYACNLFEWSAACFPDVSGDGGAYGDACDIEGSCAPGFWCADAEQVPGCDDANCCTTYCDLNVAGASEMCPGFADGQECVPLIPEGKLPPGLQNVGGCIVPSP